MLVMIKNKDIMCSFMSLKALNTGNWTLIEFSLYRNVAFCGTKI